MSVPSELVRQGWCQYVYAKDKFGDTVPPDDPDAVKFCPTGAIYASYTSQKATEAIARLFNALPHMESGKRPTTIANWNDYRGRTQQEVVTLMKSLEM